MSQSTTFTVSSITPTAKKDGYITKLQTKESKVVDLGLLGNKTQTTQLTYYIKLDKPQVKVGQEVPVDMAMFSVVERAYTMPVDAILEDGTSNPQAGQDVMLKWLHLK